MYVFFLWIGKAFKTVTRQWAQKDDIYFIKTVNKFAVFVSFFAFMFHYLNSKVNNMYLVTM